LQKGETFANGIFFPKFEKNTLIFVYAIWDLENQVDFEVDSAIYDVQLVHHILPIQLQTKVAKEMLLGYKLGFWSSGVRFLPWS